MAFSSRIDPASTGIGPAVNADFLAALQEWSSLISGSGSVDVLLTIGATQEHRAQGGPTTSILTPWTDPFNNNAPIWASAAVYKLANGTDAGATSDIIITIDPNYLQNLFEDPDPAHPTVPADKIDMTQVLAHELGHGLGITGFFGTTAGTSNTTRGTAESGFDTYVVFENGKPYFTGINAEAVYGGPVPLTDGGPTNDPTYSQNIYHVGNAISDPLLGTDLMTGADWVTGSYLTVSALDAAIIRDVIAAAMTAPQTTWFGANGSYGDATAWSHGVPGANNAIAGSGTISTAGSVINSATLTLDRVGAAPLVLNNNGGGLSQTSTLKTLGSAGEVLMDVSAPGPSYELSNFGTIHDATGTLVLNMGNHTRWDNSGSIVSQSTTGTAAVTLNQTATDATSTFVNYGYMGARAGTGADTLTVNLLATPTDFYNVGTIQAQGKGDYVSLWAAPLNSPNGVPSSPFLSQIINDGTIRSDNGAQMFVTAPVVGTGTMEANDGSLLKLSGPIANGETIALSSGVLEFGPAGSIANPAMQFYGTITGEDATSAILLDGCNGVSDSLLSLANGVCELQVFDPTHTEVADLRFFGNYQQSNFVLTPHIGVNQSDTWTALMFK